MAIDPLAQATRASKRNLLIASLVAITYKAFDVTIEKIPLPGGFSLTFEPGLFSFLLAAVLIYLLCTFSLYYFIDIRNLEVTEHQELADKSFHDHSSGFLTTYKQAIEARLDKRVPPEFSISIGSLPEAMHPGPYFRALRRTPIKDIKQFVTIKRKTGYVTLAREASDYKELYSRVDAQATRYLRRYWLLYNLSYARVLGRFLAVRGAYTLRNYVFDGFLPLLLGLIAAFAIFNAFSLRWLQSFVPPH